MAESAGRRFSAYCWGETSVVPTMFARGLAGRVGPGEGWGRDGVGGVGMTWATRRGRGGETCAPEGVRAMDDEGLYHQGNRELQDRFDCRRIADRLEQVTLHDRFSEGDRDFIERSAMFFLATADAEGQPDVSYKGGMPGFVRVLDDRTLAFPDYDGNGMFKSLGNVLLNPRVGLLFVDFEHPNRMRVNGTASVSTDDPLLAEFC